MRRLYWYATLVVLAHAAVVLGEKQWHFAPAVKEVGTQQRMSDFHRARARYRLDLFEIRFPGSSVRFGNPRRPVVPEPCCW